MEAVVNQKQLSLTEWFAQIKHKDTELLREEDNSKRERLDVLSKIIPIKYDKPVKFKAIDFYNQIDEVKKFLNEHGEELCAFRLVPFNPELPKLRIRGKSAKESISWFMEQNIDFNSYELHIVPHETPLYSTIFIANKLGIQGEIIRGLHSELTQGYTTSQIMSFYFNFKNWIFSNEDSELQNHMKNIINELIVADLQKQKSINEKLNGEFCNNYLLGYFETTSWPSGDILFIDYNRILHRDVKIFISIGKAIAGKLTGNIANPGNVRGNVKLVYDDNVNIDINEENILVCRMTSVDYLPLMAKCSGLITDLGGILSHAAIVSRELGKPCLVGVGNATKELKDGDFIELDANNGEIKWIK